MKFKSYLIKHPISNKYFKIKKKNKNLFNIEITQNRYEGTIFLTKKIPIKKISNLNEKNKNVEAEEHLDNLLETLLKTFNFSKNIKILGFSYKDQSILERFNKKNFKNTSIIKLINSNSIVDIQNKFCKQRVVSTKKKFDLIIIRHVIEHSYNINNFISNLKLLINKDGVIVFEIPDVSKMLNRGDCTMLWEEHTYYFTKNTFLNILNKFNFKILLFKSYKYLMENSLVFVVKSNYKFTPSKNISNKKINYYNDIDKFFKLHTVRKKKIINYLKMTKKNGQLIALFGAGHLASTFITMMNIENFFTAILDDNNNKINRYFPGTNIKISDSYNLIKKNINICLLSMNPNSIEKVIKNNYYFINNGGIFLSIFPGNKYSIDKLL